MADFKTESLIEPLKKAVKLGKEFIAGAEKTNIKLAKTAELISTFAKGLDLKSATGLKSFNDELSRTNDLVKLKKENTKQLNSAEKDLLKNQKDLSAELIKEEKILREKIKTQQVLSAGERKASLENEKNAIQRINKAKQEETLSQQKIRTANLLIAQKKRENAEIEKGIKQKALENKKLIESTSFYKKVTANVNKAQLEYKELASQFGINSKQAKKALRSFQQLDTGLRNINKLARDGRRDVGRYGIALKGIGSNLVGALGIVGGVQLFAQGLKETFNIVKNFSKEQSRLSGILGKTKEEISELTDLTKELGATTAFSAIQVTQGAVELAKAGFSIDEINKSLSATLQLATAGNIDLATSADIASNVLSGFGLAASETQRVVDVLAKSANSANVTIPSLGESFKEIASTAKILNIPIEEVGAAINALGNSGIKGTAATNTLQSSLLRLADPPAKASKAMKDLNVELFDSDGNFIGLTDSVEQLSSKFNVLTKEQQLSAASQIFGKNSANQWLTVLNSTKDVIVKDLNPATKELLELTDEMGTVTLEGADVLKLYTSELENAGGAADKLAKENLNNLDGDIKIFTSTWEGLVLSLADGNGVFTIVIRAIIQGATELISIFTRASGIIGVFIDKLSVEFEPVVNLVRKLFSSFGDFNIKGAFTELILGRLVIGFKVLVLPIRLLFQNILLLKDAFDIVTNEGKKFLNFLGGDFEVNPKINTDKIIKRFADIKDVIVDTFTYSDIDAKKIEDSLKTVTDKVKVNLGKNGLGSGSESGSEIEKVDKLNGAIEKQRLLVNELSKDKEQAKEKDIAGLNVLLESERAELKRLEDLGKEAKEDPKSKSVRDDSQFELDKYRLEQQLVIYGVYTEERKKKEIEFIEFKRDYAVKQEGLNKAEIKLIKEKANQEILDLDKRFEDKRIADAKKREDELQKFLKDAYAKTINFLSDLYDKLNKRKIEGIEREVEAGVKNQEIINRGIESGSKIGEQSLALEKKQQEDREAELIRLENKALKLKAFIALLEVWGSTGSVGEALAGFAKVKGVADGAFYEGTDYVGEGQETKVHNGKDGYVGMLNKGEIVFNNKEADEARNLGYTTRDSMMNLMRMASTGVSGGSSVEVVMNDNTRLINVMEENNRLLAKLPSQISTHKTGLTDDPRYIEEVMKKSNITNRAKRRANGSWANR